MQSGHWTLIFFFQRDTTTSKTEEGVDYSEEGYDYNSEEDDNGYSYEDEEEEDEEYDNYDEVKNIFDHFPIKFICNILSYTGVNLFSFIFFTDEGEERGAGLLEMHMDEPDEDDDYGYADDE